MDDGGEQDDGPQLSEDNDLQTLRDEVNMENFDENEGTIQYFLYLNRLTQPRAFTTLYENLLF